MLIEFRVENHRSLRDEQVLTMEAAPLGDPKDPRPRQVDGHAERLLPVAALYGPNASGKSNVLAALAFMQDVVLSSHRSWDPEGGVPRDPFAWGEHAVKPSMFEVTLLLDNVRYQYGFVVDNDRFLEEWLYAWPKGRKQTWFEREGDEFTFGEHLRGENKTVQQVTRTNSLFLSTAVQLKHEQLMPIQRAFRFFSSIRRGPKQMVFTRWWLAGVLQRSEAAKRQLRLFENDLEVAHFIERDDRDSLLELLQAADVGIVDLKVTDGDTLDSHFRSSRSTSSILVKHRSASAEAWLPLEEESQGTLGLLHLAPHLLRALREGQLLIVDELEASLHPLLAFALVQHFNDPAKNPRNAQLIFTTHDTNLLGTTLGEPPLRRDQVWLTEKDEEGATRVYPLTDYKPRKEENLERGYLQGRYGATPFLGELVPPPGAESSR